MKRPQKKKRQRWSGAWGLDEALQFKEVLALFDGKTRPGRGDVRSICAEIMRRRSVDDIVEDLLHGDITPAQALEALPEGETVGGGGYGLGTVLEDLKAQAGRLGEVSETEAKLTRDNYAMREEIERLRHVIQAKATGFCPWCSSVARESGAAHADSCLAFTPAGAVRLFSAPIG